MKQRTQAGTCWRALSSVSGYYGIYRVRGLRLLRFWRSFNLLDVMWLRIKCYFSACKRVRSPTCQALRAMEYCTFII